MANEWVDQLTCLVPRDNEAILIAGVDLIQLKAKAADEALILLSLLGSRCVQHMLRCVVHNLILVILVLEQFLLHRSDHINFLRELLLVQIPYCKKEGK